MVIYYGLVGVAALLGRSIDRWSGAADDPTDTSHALNRPKARRAAVLAIAFFVLVGALRWRVGTDYWTYAAKFRGYVDAPFASYRPLNEPGIKVLARVGAFIYDDYASMFALASIITLGLFVWTLCRWGRPSVALTLVLFVFQGTFLASFNVVRQYLACALVFAGHRLIIDRKPGRYLCVVGLASLFHVSALALVFLYFVPRKQLRLAGITALMVGAVLGAEVYSRVMLLVSAVRDNAAEIQTSSSFIEEVSWIRIAVALAPLIFYLAFVKKIRLAPDDAFYVNMLFVHAAILVAASQSAYVARFSLYTGVYTALALPRLLRASGLRNRALFSPLLIVGYAIYWYLETAGIPSLAVYQTIFQRQDGQ